MAINSQDEPALFEGLKAVILQLIFAVAGAAGFALNDDVKAAIVTAVTLAVGALVSYIQARTTRAKVFSPASVEQAKVEATGQATTAMLSPTDPDVYA